MANNRAIKKNKFDAIRNELLTTTRTQAQIAADYDVPSTTVSLVNNVRTWGNYLTGTKAKHTLRGPVTVPKPSKSERAKRAGLKPVDLEERRLATGLQAIERKHAQPTPAVLITTPDPSAHLPIIPREDIADAPVVSDGLRFTVAITLASVAFIVSIIALVK